MKFKLPTSPPLILLFILAGVPQFSETVYSPALPNIVRMLHTSNHMVQWTLSIYFIGFAIGMFFWGKLSDKLGRRPTMLAGVSLYILGSFFCIIANNIDSLLLARLVQGFGASSISVLSQTIARESLAEEKRNRFFATVGFVIALSIALGPFIGGYITQWFDWRANFTLLLFAGIALIIFVSLYLPETRSKDITQKKKVSTVILMLLKDKRVLASIWLVAAVNGLLYSYFAEAPFIFIQLLHLSTSQYGWLGAGVALAALLGSLSSRHLLKTISVDKLLATGCTIILISSALLLAASLSGLITAAHSVLATALILLPMMGIIYGGFGFIMPLTLSNALLKYKSVLGTAGALFGLSYYIIVAILIWVMSVIQNGTVIPMPIYFFALSAISFLIYFFVIRNHPA